LKGKESQISSSSSTMMVKTTNVFLKTQNLRDFRIFKNRFFGFLPS
jgi:hypothetical protein